MYPNPQTRDTEFTFEKYLWTLCVLIISLWIISPVLRVFLDLFFYIIQCRICLRWMHPQYQDLTNL